MSRLMNIQEDYINLFPLSPLTYLFILFSRHKILQNHQIKQANTNFSQYVDP